jgi:hypothetical protein
VNENLRPIIIRASEPGAGAPSWFDPLGWRGGGDE